MITFEAERMMTLAGDEVRGVPFVAEFAERHKGVLAHDSGGNVFVWRSEPPMTYKERSNVLSAYQEHLLLEKVRKVK